MVEPRRCLPRISRRRDDSSCSPDRSRNKRLGPDGEKPTVSAPHANGVPKPTGQQNLSRDLGGRAPGKSPGQQSSRTRHGKSGLHPANSSQIEQFEKSRNRIHSSNILRRLHFGKSHSAHRAKTSDPRPCLLAESSGRGRQDLRSRRHPLPRIYRKGLDAAAGRFIATSPPSAPCVCTFL